MAQQLHQE
jgi:mannose-6-phosphate isomerase